MFPLPSPAPDRTLLFLVRHGATANNQAQPPRLQGCRSDPPLSEQGRWQAECVGRFLAAQPIAAVYTSPLIRAAQTAAAIAAPHGHAVQTVPGLIECDVGRWEGRDWEEISRSEPEEHRRFLEDAERHPYAGGENLGQVRERIVPAFAELFERHPGQAIVAAAHNVVNRCYAAHIIGIPLKFTRRIPQHNCGINVFRWERGKVKLLTVNLLLHLEGEW